MGKKKKAGEGIPATMRSVRQQEPGGPLSIEQVPVPLPRQGEVLVKMAASPINPSDLANLSGGYKTGSWPFTPGLEGSGTIVRSGAGLLPAMRLGKRVACSPNPGEEGTWAEYMCTSVMRTVPLPGNITTEQGAMMLVNPMTAMAFIQMATHGEHSAMVNNAAASTLGRMLIQLAGHYSIPLISIVRKAEQVEELKSMGAVHVLNSTGPGFEQELKEMTRELGATLILDAVTGEETGRLLKAAPDGSTLVAYARLSGDPIRADPADLIRLDKTITGFQLGNWLSSKNIPFKLRFVSKVKKQLSGRISARIQQRLPLEQAEQAVHLYRENMSKGKVLLTMNRQGSLPNDVLP